MRQLFSLFFLLMPCLVSAQQSVEIDFTQLANKTHTYRTVALFEYYGLNSKHLDSTSVFADVELVRQLAKQHNDEHLLLEADLMELHYFTFIGRTSELRNLPNEPSFLSAKRRKKRTLVTGAGRKYVGRNAARGRVVRAVIHSL